MRLSKSLLALAVLVLVGCTADAALAAKRVALLIGNAGYANVARLTNPPNDVATMKATFEAAGFDSVVGATDLGHDALIKALRSFADQAQGADIAIVYYSGHGLELNGQNYLVPVDAKLASDRDVEDEAVTLDRVMHSLDGAKKLKLVILDACRNNPFLAGMARADGSRAVDRGLARIEPATTDTLVAYAAKAGTTASDGDGQDSPFTAALAKHLVEPGIDIRLALGKVRDDVMAATSGRQEPFAYGSLGGQTVALAEAPAAPPTPVAPPPAPVAQDQPVDNCKDAAAHWAVAQKFDRLEFYREHLQHFGSCAFAGFAKARIAELSATAAAPKAPAPVIAQAPAAVPQAPVSVPQAPAPVAPSVTVASLPAKDPLAGTPMAPLTDCDKVAADPSDNDKVVEGTLFNKVDGAVTVERCRAAIQQYPKARRFMYQLGRGLQRLKDFQGAFNAYSAAARLGSAAGVRNLGNLYYGGLGVPKDPANAAQLFQRAASQGDRGGMMNLGRLYEVGNGVPQDFGRAIELYRSSAAKGDRAAMFRLGLLFLDGKGVTRDPARAAQFFQQAVDAGNMVAAARLAAMYESGTGVPRDLAMAAKLRREAADDSDASGEGDQAAPQPTPNFAPVRPAATAVRPGFQPLPRPNFAPRFKRGFSPTPMPNFGASGQ